MQNTSEPNTKQQG